MKRIPLISSFILFILLCATSSYWVLQLIKPETRKISAPQITKPTADVESVAGLFGGAMAVDTNYQLKGVVLANPMGQSVAIIAVDGKPTQAYPMNTELSPGVTLNEVHSGYILLLDNGISKRVDLPQDSKASMQTMNTVPDRYPNPVANPVMNDQRSNVENTGGNRGNKSRLSQLQTLNLPPPNAVAPVPTPTPTPIDADNKPADH
ncbi:type II secretion system protein N [Solimicrobium silvestre]|uniref:Type II secretion system protein GspC N-terminal domain-containing protein n=1 Tax=Solimicrobium silvestre TaxID=2099400 RepID=A0A2S9GYS7_9BURK|nr:type II secretion system protein N [Solimicrobium silvestre]PRC92869.1 hypothetical protein S2091_2286 [Solimicrobium silvestre]